jgi:hypothetical protein
MTVRQQSADSIRKEIEKENKVASESVVFSEIIDQCNRGLAGGDIVCRRALEDIHDLCFDAVKHARENRNESK